MIDEAERRIGYVFKDKELLRRALTLASASEDNNQQLEFFGDAILEFIVSERIFADGGSEGTLTERRKNLVADGALTPVSERLGLDRLLIRAKNDTSNKKAVPSAYEAVVAAIYLDGGMEAAKRFVLGTLDFTREIPTALINYKGMLQELLQAEGEAPPEYKCEDIGTEHKHVYRVTVCVSGREFTGEGEKKSAAEQLAAKEALKFREV